MKKRYITLPCALLLFASCLRKAIEFPKNDLKQLQSNYRLRDLSALQPEEGKPVCVTDSFIVHCLVRADDSSGNFYNQLILEDSTAGIALLLNANSLYTRFPENASVYLLMKGLFLGNNHGTLQLGGTPVADNKGILQVSDIPAAQIDAHIVTAADQIDIPVQDASLRQLKDSPGIYCNRIVQLSDVEWANPLKDEYFAPDGNPGNTTLSDCRGDTITVRTSNYASFHAQNTPAGRGILKGIFSVYNTVGQLTLRHANDLDMTSVRCDGSSGAAATEISISALRDLYRGKDTVLPALSIRGVVTSDEAHQNFGTGNIVLQQNNKGITIYFGSAAGDLPDMGDSVSINVSGATLTSYNGLLEIKNITTAKVKTVAQNISVTPVTLTIKELNDHFTEYESVLIKTENARVAGGGKYSGNKTLSDASGSIILYTSSSATFANETIPSISKTFRGIVTPYGSTKELKIRYPAIDIY
ncbi:MAG: DUF5689 domain-containing protein [Chitinophagaceae bacterium]